MEPRERLHHLRKNILKITQDEFSSKINIKRSTLSNIEKGRIAFTERTIGDICRAFHVSRNWLVNGIEPPFTSVGDGEALQEIAAIYAKLDEKYRIQLIGYMQRLLEEQQQS